MTKPYCLFLKMSHCAFFISKTYTGRMCVFAKLLLLPALHVSHSDCLKQVAAGVM